MKIIIMKKTDIIIPIVLFTFATSGSSQGFVNLDFESANVSGYSPNSSDVPVSDALPGWTAYYSNSGGSILASEVWYDGISLGGSMISIIDANAGSFAPIQGTYSAFLFGGGSVSSLYSASISQTGVVPVGTETLLFDAYVSGASFEVTLGGQTITMTPLQVFPDYTLYSGSIPANLVGRSETLTFTEPPATASQPSMFELDDIQFSSSAVPEPSTLSLSTLGVFFLAWQLRRKRISLLTFYAGERKL